jgi:hypothetical protein
VGKQSRYRRWWQRYFGGGGGGNPISSNHASAGGGGGGGGSYAPGGVTGLSAEGMPLSVTISYQVPVVGVRLTPLNFATQAQGTLSAPQTLTVTDSDGSSRDVDLTGELHGPVFEPLADPHYLHKFT